MVKKRSRTAVRPRAGTFIGNVPSTHKNARPRRAAPVRVAGRAKVARRPIDRSKNRGLYTSAHPVKPAKRQGTLYVSKSRSQHTGRLRRTPKMPWRSQKQHATGRVSRFWVPRLHPRNPANGKFVDKR